MGRNYTKDDLSKYKLNYYTIDDHWEVIAGKTDFDNDYLSIKLANANDYWFHVKGMPGSHVILRVEKGENPDKSILEKAASIAAYHSKARNGGLTPVSCTLAKNVSKPRGAKPGSVTIKKEIVLKVKPGLPE
jgi:predicted ribosome quality control (RQC) complex YloA/Tae2 family protein